jgi:hypothetical protein
MSGEENMTTNFDYVKSLSKDDFIRWLLFNWETIKYSFTCTKIGMKEWLDRPYVVCDDNTDVRFLIDKAEFKVLSKIAKETKMDCWFCISETEGGIPHVYDVEQDRIMPISEGISLLLQGVPSYEKCRLTKEEIEVIEILLNKLQIIF